MQFIHMYRERLEENTQILRGLFLTGGMANFVCMCSSIFSKVSKMTLYHIIIRKNAI